MSECYSWSRHWNAVSLFVFIAALTVAYTLIQMAITPCGGVQSMHCLHYVNNACFLSFFDLINLYQVIASFEPKFIWMSIMQGFSKWAQVGEVPQKLWSRFSPERKLNSQSVTRQRLWLEENISMVTAGFARDRREVKEACRFFLLPIQLDHNITVLTGLCRTKQNVNEEIVICDHSMYHTIQ